MIAVKESSVRIVDPEIRMEKGVMNDNESVSHVEDRHESARDSPGDYEAG